jgi:hypothetical protein
VVGSWKQSSAVAVSVIAAIAAISFFMFVFYLFWQLLPHLLKNTIASIANKNAFADLVKYDATAALIQMMLIVQFIL